MLDAWSYKAFDFHFGLFAAGILSRTEKMHSAHVICPVSSFIWEYTGPEYRARLSSSSVSTKNMTLHT